MVIHVPPQGAPKAPPSTLGPTKVFNLLWDFDIFNLILCLKMKLNILITK